MGASAGAELAPCWGFALILAFTLYVILDFEYPRLGLIRIDDFDKLLVQVQGLDEVTFLTSRSVNMEDLRASTDEKKGCHTQVWQPDT